MATTVTETDDVVFLALDIFLHEHWRAPLLDHVPVGSLTGSGSECALRLVEAAFDEHIATEGRRSLVQ